MVELLRTKPEAAPDPIFSPRPSTAFWPVDKLILGYAGFTSVILAGWWPRIHDAPLLAALHVILVALLILEVRVPNRTSRVFRYWYPLPYVASCYKEMALLIPAIRSH